MRSPECIKYSRDELNCSTMKNRRFHKKTLVARDRKPQTTYTLNWVKRGQQKKRPALFHHAAVCDTVLEREHL